MLKNIPENLKSRKLFAFLLTVVIVLANYVLNLKMPSDSVYSLVAMSASYILGQGFVDAKQQPVKDLPVADITASFAAIIQTELAKIPAVKNLPIADIMDAFKALLSGELSKVSSGQNLSRDDLMVMFKSILATEMAKINTFTLSPAVVSAPAVAPSVVPEVVVDSVPVVDVPVAVDPAPAVEPVA